MHNFSPLMLFGYVSASCQVSARCYCYRRVSSLLALVFFCKNSSEEERMTSSGNKAWVRFDRLLVGAAGTLCVTIRQSVGTTGQHQQVGSNMGSRKSPSVSSFFLLCLPLSQSLQCSVFSPSLPHLLSLTPSNSHSYTSWSLQLLLFSPHLPSSLPPSLSLSEALQRLGPFSLFLSFSFSP